MKKKLIIDVDTGVDDAQAIMVALADPNVEILGITCCNGNTPVENVLKNTLRVLKVCNRLDVSFGYSLYMIEWWLPGYHEVKPVILYRSQCTAAVQNPFWAAKSTLEISMGRMGWVMCQMQTLQAWSCCRRKKLCRPWSKWSMKTLERWVDSKPQTPLEASEF